MVSWCDSKVKLSLARRRSTTLESSLPHIFFKEDEEEIQKESSGRGNRENHSLAPTLFLDSSSLFLHFLLKIEENRKKNESSAPSSQDDSSDPMVGHSVFSLFGVVSNLGSDTKDYGTTGYFSRSPLLLRIEREPVGQSLVPLDSSTARLLLFKENER